MTAPSGGAYTHEPVWRYSTDHKIVTGDYPPGLVAGGVALARARSRPDTLVP